MKKNYQKPEISIEEVEIDTMLQVYSNNIGGEGSWSSNERGDYEDGTWDNLW